MIDVPAGWAVILAAGIAALLGIVGALIAQRSGRVARLERENRRLWLAVRLAVDALYRGGVDVSPTLLNLINPEGDE